MFCFRSVSGSLAQGPYSTHSAPADQSDDRFAARPDPEGRLDLRLQMARPPVSVVGLDTFSTAGANRVSVATAPGDLKPPQIHQIKGQTAPKNPTFQLSPEVKIKPPPVYTCKSEPNA